MNVIKPGIEYELESGGTIEFTHDTPEGRFEGATSCEILDVMIHRLQTLNKGPHYCGENIKAIFALQDAKKWLELRHKRVQGEK